MKLINILIIAALLNILSLTSGCKKNPEKQPIPAIILPIVSTNTATKISSTSVISGGEITSLTNITDKGLIWGIDSNTLTISNVNKLSNGAGLSNFTDTISNLQPNATYYLRAYAINSSGVGYGMTIKFTTLPPQPTVYTAGCIGIDAVYWKNDTPVYLTVGTDIVWAWARSVYVVGNDVFVAGEEMHRGENSRAVYWKNGQKVHLTDGTNSGHAFSIFVAGNDVYVAGYETNGNIPVAKYWKNGVSVSLTAGTSYNNGNAYSIYVTGNDVYVAGAMSNDFMGSNVVTYWKNGIAIPLSDSTNASGYANSITVKGNDVYVAGTEKPGVGVSGVPVAKYWKNGLAVSLTDGSQFASAWSIYVVGSDVYVAGHEYDGRTGYSVAKYWKNGIPSTLTDGTKYARANSIFVAGNDVYVGFDEAFSPSSPYYQAKYWKSGASISLFPTTKESRATSIFVQ